MPDPAGLIVRVYYEDTDAAGIVYYANYLKYIERGRTEWVRGLGVDQVALRRDHGVVFVVRRLVADYFAPARLDDVLTVTTTPTVICGARLCLAQAVLRGADLLFSAEVTLACVTDSGTVARVPGSVRAALSGKA